MSTADRFKFIRELELSRSHEEKLTSHQSSHDDESVFGKLVYCHFSQVKEQVQNEVERLAQDPSDYHSTSYLPKRDQRCYFKASITMSQHYDKSLRIYSRGGSEFIITLLFPILDVFPIEDGLIIKTEYNRDLIHFDPFTIRNQQQQQLPQFAYMTVTGHPLSDVHPLSFGTKDSHEMIATTLDIIKVGYKIPMVVLYNSQNYQTIFGLLQNKIDLQMNIDMMNKGESYIRSIEPSSRHSEIYNISKDSKLTIEEIHTISSPNSPTFVDFSISMFNSYELIVYLFNQQSQVLDFYSCDIRQLKKWRNTQTFNNIQDVRMITFSRQKHSSSQSIRLISKSLAKMLNSSNTYEEDQQTLSALSALKRRLKNYHKDLIVLDSNQSRLSIYQGTSLIHQIDFQYLNNHLAQINSASQQQNKNTSQIVGLKKSSKSNVTLVYGNGEEKRVRIRLEINDFMVNSVFKVIRRVLEQDSNVAAGREVYENLYKDFIESITRSGQEFKQNPNTSQSFDPFSRLTSLLVQILQGDQYQRSLSKSFTQGSQQQTMQQPTQSLNQSMISQSSSSVNSSQTKPNQTLHTKILRSSTTSFNDGMATRRKTTQLTQAQQMQVQQQQMQQQQMQTRSGAQTGKYSQQSSGAQTRQSMPIVNNKSALVRRATQESNQPFSFAPTMTSPVSQVSNPFQELLNSDFHKQNFGTQFSALFPTDFVIKPPHQVSQQQQLIDEKPTQVSVSPTKSSTNKSVSSQKITSTKQSNTFQATHERKNSNLTGSVIQQQQQQQQQQTFSTAASQAHQPITISVQLGPNYRTNQQELVKYLPLIFESLHLLYEDLKLNNLRDKVYSPQLAKLLIQLAVIIDPYGKAAYVEHYFKEHPQALKDLNEDIKKYYKDGPLLRPDVEIQPVPRIFKWIENQLKKSNGLLSFKYPLLFENSRKLVRLYELLNDSTRNSYLHQILISSSQQSSSQWAIDSEVLLNSIVRRNHFKDSSLSSLNSTDYLMNDKLKDLHPFEKILFCLKDESMNLDDLKKIPSIVALPIMEIIRYARLFQSEIQSLPVWPDSLYRLIQREDILNNLRLFERNTANSNNILNTVKAGQNAHFHHSLMDNMQRQTSKKYALNRGLTNVFVDNSQEEIAQEEHRKQMQSNIIRTTADLIYNSGEISSNSNSDISNKNTSIGDFFRNRFSQDTRLKEVQNMLNSTSEIIVKLEHIQNRETLSEEVFNTEKQKLLDKMFLRQLAKCPGRGALQFGTQQTIPTEVLNIPKINQTGYAPMNETYMQVEFKDDAAQKEMLQWAEFHNGVASALRIAQSFKQRDFNSKDNGSGVSTQHTRNWIMYHKPQEPKYEHGGFLLAIGLLGQLDTLQPTDIYQHLKSTHDATAIGVLLGRSASKIGSMDDHDTRTLCIHIPYLLPPTLSIDISLSIQSAAVIGAGLLYKGTSNRLMTEMLLAQIGRKPLSDKAIEREGYALASGLALGLVNLGVGNKMQGLSDLKLDERLIRYVEGGKIIDLPQSMLSQNFNHENSSKSGQGCSSIKEGDMVNVHITSQGALVALALIHLKSNNQQIANQLQMPQTFYQLESVRPGFLLIKTLCRNLIMWDQVNATREWVLSQIPTLIREIYENDIVTVMKKTQQKTVIEDGIDFSTVALCYVNIVAGAIFSIGFKYVGTGNKQAFQLVNEYAQHFFRKLKIVQSNKDSIGVIHNNFTKNQVDKNTVETCLCVCAFSMSMIMAGTGDVECFRSLRILRKRFENDMHYGYNMAIHMSLGFLFLGTGAFTFSSNDMSIAALLCSLYPVFPQNPNDNRHHLQALRHFYVLAIETRLLQARDIDNGEFLQIEMDVTSEETNQSGQIEIKTQKIKTPDIINGTIKQIEVHNDSYHNVTIDGFGTNQNQQNSSLNVLELKKPRVFEQFGFQRIIYLKKKAINSQEQNHHNEAVEQSILPYSLVNDELYGKLHSKDSFTRDLMEQVGLIYGKVSQIKDPSIEAFHAQFARIDKLQYQEHFGDIEDVLLSSTKNQYGQLSPADFFRVQDTYDQIQGCFMSKEMLDNAKLKLQTLRVLHDSYFNDKVDFIKVMMDCTHTLDSDHKSLLQAYLKYRSNQNQLNRTERDQIFVQSVNSASSLNSQNKEIQDSVQRIQNAQFIGGPLANETQSIDLYTAYLCKQITEQILNELNVMGESELTARYKHKKVNSQPLGEDGPLLEINESLKMSIQTLIGEQNNSVSDSFLRNDNNAVDNTGDSESVFIDKVLLPVILRF